MVKRFRVLTIALLGANNAMKKHGDVVVKEDLTGSVDDLIADGFIEEIKETQDDKKAKAEAAEKAKEAERLANEADRLAKEAEAAEKSKEAERLAKEADRLAKEAEAAEKAKEAEVSPVSNPLIKNLKK